MTTQHYPQVDQYAATLVALVREAFPDGTEDARSWEELHSICDANDFLAEADEKHGIDVFGGEDIKDDELNEYARFTSDAIDIASAVLWAEPTENG